MLETGYSILDPSIHPDLPADDADNADLHKGTESASICGICGNIFQAVQLGNGGIQHPASRI
jgi:hypothetical protein